MQLISFYHGNENVTIVGKESLVGRQREPMLWELGVTSLWAPRGSPSASTVSVAQRGWLPCVGALWRGEPWPLALAGGFSRTPERRVRMEPGGCTGRGTVPPSDCL